MKKLIIFSFIICNGLYVNYSANAADSEIKLYVESGKRSTTEDFEDVAQADDYRYQKYYFKFKQELNDRLRYDFTTQVYDKDYEDREDLDNITRTIKNNWVNYLKKDKAQSLKFDVKLQYKEKRYNNTPTSEYDETQAQAGITYNRKKNYKVSFFAGIKDIHYLEPTEKDQFAYFGKLGFDKDLFDNKLRLINSAKFERSNREKNDRDRTKYDLTTGFDYKVKQAWLEKIAVRSTRARRNTKSEEDRDDDSDYEYWKHYIKTTHKLSKRLQTSLKYQNFKRDYLISDLDNRGSYLQNTWRYDFIKSTKKALYMSLSLKHKRVDYSLRPEYDYESESYDIKVVYDLKNNLKFTGALQTDFYNYANNASDKKEYYTKLGIEKAFQDDRLAITLDLKYKYSDYIEKNNKSREAARLTFKYKF